jgi:hypothetical protein
MSEFCVFHLKFKNLEKILYDGDFISYSSQSITCVFIEYGRKKLYMLRSPQLVFEMTYPLYLFNILL